MSKILVIDDRPSNRDYFVTLLGYGGHELIEAADGVSGLNLARKEKPDLIIVDIVMPEMDGYEFIRQLRSDPGIGGTPAIFHTANYLEDEVRRMADMCGVKYIIVKPSEPGEILEKVKAALAEHGPLVKPVKNEEFDREHLLMLTNKLSQKVNELEEANSSLERVVESRTTELKAANEGLEAANKELEAFAYSVSHDLRAPLRAMEGFSNLVMDRFAPELPDEGKKLLEHVAVNARHMKQLIEDLLTFSRMTRQPLAKKEVNLSELLNQALEDLAEERAGRSIEVRAEPLPDWVGDATLLKQVFANLLSNAFKFTRRREQALVEVSCQTRNGELTCCVRDNGVGFELEYARNLFGVFQRFHHARDYDGTGVGLSIVQRVIHRHGGRVWAESAPEKGASFYFTLPKP